MEDILKFVDILAWVFIVPLWLLCFFHLSINVLYLSGPKYKYIEMMRKGGGPVKHPTFPWVRWGLYACICTCWIIARA
ncbi:MAG: hypothetical protein NWE76_05355 [Candidatus Bathyarchaeota archaeon]|nr:hypothetical protein [Candidatus Bathyarchaeota archaeon]